MTLLEAIRHPSLLAPLFGGDEWARWRVFLAAVDGESITDPADLELYRQCTGRTVVPTKPAREVYAIVGRRGGKSRVAAVLAIAAACLRDWTPHLAPGERATIAVIASDRDQTRAVMGYIKGILDSVPLLKRLMERPPNADGVDLVGRVRIEVRTCSMRTTRSYTYAAVIADELAFWRTDESAEPDVEILKAVRPGMLTLPGARLIGISSPYARRGALWEAFRDHYGQDGDPVLVWKADTTTMHPKVDQAFLAEEYEKDPIAAAAEYGADFRRDLEGFVSREVLEAVTVAGRSLLPLQNDLRYVAFADPSGGSQDAFSLAIAHAEMRKGEVIGVLDQVVERLPPFSPDGVTQEFAAMLKSYRLAEVMGDRYGGEWPSERFNVHGITYVPSERTKSELYGEALPILMGQRCELLEVKRLTQQLLGLERRVSRQGKDSIDHAPGGHDDVANAAMGALVLAVEGGARGDGPTFGNLASKKRTPTDWGDAH